MRQQVGIARRLPAALLSLAKRPFMRKVTAVISGNAVAQAITMGFAPFITRIYGPEAFGVQGTFLSMVSIVVPLSALAYPIAIVLPQSDNDAIALRRLSMLVSVGVAAALWLVLLLAFDVVAMLVANNAAVQFLYLLPLIVLLAAAFQVSQQWLVRKQNFDVMARIAVMQALLVNILRVGLGFINATATMLVALTTFGIGLHAAMQWWAGRRNTKSRPGLPEVARQARLHKNFPLFRAPEMILNAVAESMPVLVLAASFGPTEAGFYALARSVLYIPLQLIGQSVADVFYPKLNAEASAGRPLLPILLKAFSILALIGLPIFCFISVVSPFIFPIVFGSEWQKAGSYASILSLWAFVMFINRPCIGATSVMSMQKVFLMQGGINLVLGSTSLWIGANFLDDIWTIGIFTLSSAVAASMLIILVIIRARNFSYKVEGVSNV